MQFPHITTFKSRAGFCHFFVPHCASGPDGVCVFFISIFQMVRTPRVLQFFTSKCALRHKGAFSTPQLQYMLGIRFFLPLLTSQCALRHTGLQCFISYLASQLRREPFFPTAGATELWKAYFFRDVRTFSRTCVFFFWSFSISDFRPCFFPADYFHALYSCVLSGVFIFPYCRTFRFQTLVGK